MKKSTELPKFSIHMQDAGLLRQFPGAVLVEKLDQSTGIISGRLARLKLLTLAVRRALYGGGR
jgi:hypothetical protein